MTNSNLFCVALTRPTLTQVWKDRVLRVHRLSNRQYTYYIQPELLFRHSFGSEPSEVVLNLIQTNEKCKAHCFFIFGDVCCFVVHIFFFFFAGAATMKINKSKLKNLVEKGDPVALVNIKRKRVNEGQSFVLS